MLFQQRHPPAPNTPEPSDNRRRKTITLFASLSVFISIVFTILVLVGSTNDSATLSSIYFIRIDVSNIIPRSFPNAVLVNSIAQTIGLRDFYQVGLWNYCEGYKGRGVTYCDAPKTLYSFNPVKILLSQLLARAEIAIPGNIESALDMAKAVSHWMFGLYFVGICLSAASFAIGCINCTGHFTPMLTNIVSFLAALFTTVAATISTALFAVFRSVFEERPDLNIKGSLDMEMFTFLWIAVGFSMTSFVFHTSSYCCVRGRKLRRDRKEMRKLLDQKIFSNPSRDGTTIGGEGNPGRIGIAVTNREEMGEKPPEEMEEYLRVGDIGRAI